MPTLKYIGRKHAGERAFIDQTGIVWMPGEEHDVSLANAALMLKHEDVWELVEPNTDAPPPLTLASVKTKAKRA